MKLGEEALEPLVRALKQGPKYRVLDAAKTLGELGDRRAIQPLMEVSEKWYGDVKEEVGLALYRRSGQKKEENTSHALACWGKPDCSSQNPTMLAYGLNYIAG